MKPATSAAGTRNLLEVELLYRIRELEAELISTREALNNAWSIQRAASTAAEKAEARVAELEARVKWLEDPKNWVDEYGQPDEGHFAREREAE